MSRSKRRLCGALALLILLGGALAESVPEDAPTAVPEPAATAEPTATDAAADATEPADAPEPSATIEPTDTIEPAATIEPTDTIEPTESIEPTDTIEPTATIEPTDTPEPSATIEPTASIEPTVSPEPSAPVSAIGLRPEGDAQQIEQVWQITLSAPDAQIAFIWSEIPGAERVCVQISDADGNVLLFQDVAENRIALAPADYPDGPYTLRIEAWAGEALLLSEEARFMLAQGRPGGGSGGFGGGGFGGSRGGSGGGSAPEGAAEQGFRVTPGQALTSSHASGTGDMRIYGTVSLETSDAEMTLLTLGESELRVTLDGGAAFTASLDESTLLLQPVAAGARWEINLSALQTLKRSGIETLTLAIEDAEIELPTALELGGSVYGMLRAQGLVAKDFTLEISVEARTVYVAGAQYLLTDGGELATN